MLVSLATIALPALLVEKLYIFRVQEEHVTLLLLCDTFETYFSCCRPSMYASLHSSGAWTSAPNSRRSTSASSMEESESEKADDEKPLPVDYNGSIRNTSVPI